MSAAVRNLVTLRGLALEDLPHHPAFDRITPHLQTPGHTTLDFVKEVLAEAEVIAGDVSGTLRDPENPRSSTFVRQGYRASTGSTANPNLLKSTITPSEIWYARTSTHVDKAAQGTASWQEFDAGVRANHCEHEGEYDPDVYHVHRVLDYDTETITEYFSLASGYRDVNLRIYEMAHKLPSPLAPRVFPVLVITAQRSTLSAGTTDESIVVQVPINIDRLQEAFYCNGRNLREGADKLQRTKTVLGTYVSVEQITHRSGSQIEWIMATASDARGNLPKWLQRFGIPTAIAKDVGHFMTWTAGKRPPSKDATTNTASKIRAPS